MRYTDELDQLDTALDKTYGKVSLHTMSNKGRTGSIPRLLLDQADSFEEDDPDVSRVQEEIDMDDGENQGKNQTQVRIENIERDRKIKLKQRAQQMRIDDDQSGDMDDSQDDDMLDA